MADSKLSKRAVVAIDFGTTCTGYAYYVADGKLDLIGAINAEQAWIAAGKLGLQAPTTVLMSPDKKFHSFGFEAETKYDFLALKSEHHLWYYFRHFKMTLHHQKDLDRDIQLKDDTGKALNAMDIFACAIEYIRKHLQKELKSSSGEIKLADISWVITVPAIWRESAKAFMREAAEKAGVDTNKLTLALEPECAAIWCKEQAIAKKATVLKVFNPATRYIIVDLGGGTVDTTVHEVHSDGTLKELHAATGGAWGGQLVDKAFMDFVQEMVTASVWAEFIRLHTKAWILFCKAFDQCKRQFTMETEQCMIEHFPPVLKDIFKTATEKDLAEDILRRYGRKVKLYYDVGTLELPTEYMMGFFNQALDPICEHITGICTQHKLKLQYLILVGGFAESPLVKKRIEKALNGQVSIIVPRNRGTAVLKGAVLYGINPSTISSRISPFSYGISTRKKFEPTIHPKNRKIHAVDKDVVLQAFDIHIMKGQEVLVGVDNKGNRYNLLMSRLPEVDLQVYQSANKRPLFCDEDGSKRIGTLNLKIPKQLQNTDLSLTVWMTCIGTELVAHVSAEDRQGRNSVNCTCKLDFLRRDVERSSDFVESNY